ncbi:MAG: fused MFS/spermidine synthase [Gemmatimonadota bacterium]
MPLFVLAVAFVVSGAAGLIYESTWTRYLSLFVGHDAYAQVLVLVLFLGGMSAGAWLGGRWSPRSRSPLLGYAAVEAAAGGIGLVFHPAYLALTGWAYASVFPHLGAGIGGDLIKWAIAAILLLPQSLLLGASFPLMSAGVLRLDPATPGRRIALLYFANSLGAAGGVLLGGFVLVPAIGLPGAIRAAALANLGVALVVAIVAFLSQRDPALTEVPRPAPTVPPVPRDRTLTLLLAVSAGTAIASFLYEIDWIRMLSLVLGSATHSFELMLSAFILGLALGSLWISGRADRLTSPLRSLGLIQIAMGVCALGTLVAYASTFHWMTWLFAALTKSEAGYQGFTLVRYGISMAIMLPATCCAGMTLPLITKILLARGAGEQVIGTVYAWNTLGSIAGVAIGGLLLLPLLGLKGLLLVAGALDITLGIALVASTRGTELVRPPGRHLLAGMAALALLVALTAWAARLDPVAMASGVFRFGRILDPSLTQVLRTRDGRTATVSVLRQTAINDLSIRTNGKTDASVNEAFWRPACEEVSGRAPLNGDASTQVLLPLITLAYRPDARRAAIVGFGSGMSTHMLLGDPHLTKVVTIEIEPEMIAAGREFYPINRRAYDDPRATFVIGDARTYLSTGGERFDLIMSEPSNPWVSGVSGLFTVEFYQRIRSALAPGGVFGQWLHTYELDDELVLSVLGALHQVFPDYVVYQVGEGDFLIVASAEGPLAPPDWRVFDAPDLADLRCRTFPPTAGTMRALRAGGRALFAPLFDGDRRLNSDFDPVLDLGAERRRYLESHAIGLEAIVGDWRGMAGALEGAAPLIPESVPAPPFMTVAGVSSRTAAALLQERRASRNDTTVEPPDVQFAREQWKAWQFRLSGPAPSDWRSFLLAFDGMSILAHRGTAGYANPRLFASAAAFMERRGAPLLIRQAVGFRRAVLEWKMESVASLGSALLPSVRAGQGLVDREQFIDGMLIAAVRLGRGGMADSTLSELGTARRARPGDLRDDLLLAHLQRAFGTAVR